MYIDLEDTAIVEGVMPKSDSKEIGPSDPEEGTVITQAGRIISLVLLFFSAISHTIISLVVPDRVSEGEISLPEMKYRNILGREAINTPNTVSSL